MKKFKDLKEFVIINKNYGCSKINSYGVVIHMEEKMKDRTMRILISIGQNKKPYMMIDEIEKDKFKVTIVVNSDKLDELISNEIPIIGGDELIAKLMYDCSNCKDIEKIVGSLIMLDRNHKSINDDNIKLLKRILYRYKNANITNFEEVRKIIMDNFILFISNENIADLPIVSKQILLNAFIDYFDSPVSEECDRKLLFEVKDFLYKSGLKPMLPLRIQRKFFM